MRIRCLIPRDPLLASVNRIRRPWTVKQSCQVSTLKAKQALLRKMSSVPASLAVILRLGAETAREISATFATSASVTIATMTCHLRRVKEVSSVFGQPN